jgi:hypothetical protein
VHLSAADAERINLALFDEKDPLQHMMKLMFGFGMICMLRGNEHAGLLVAQIVFGNYPRTFEYPALAGHPYVALDNLIDKTCKLTVHNNYARRTSDFLRIPINEEDPACLGASVKRYMTKVAPGQVRLYCRVASAEYIQSNYRRHGNMTAMFYPNLPLGTNKVKELLAAGAKLLGLPASFRPHSLRAVGVTKLANDSSISIAEVCRAARHSSTSASRMYQTTDGISEANRLRALGLNLPSQAAPLTRAEQEQVELPAVAEAKSDSVTPLNDECMEFVDVSAAVARAERQDGNSSDTSTCSNFTEVDLSIHRKNKKFKTPEDERPSMTQVQLDKLQEQVSSLKGLIKVEKKKVPEPVSMTQAGIIDLTEEIGELEKLVEKRDAPKKIPPPPSANQLAIRELQKKVKKLTDELEMKELYCDSLENDFFDMGGRQNTSRKRKSEYEELLEEKNDLERQNQELMSYINRDKKRAMKRRNWDY